MKILFLYFLITLALFSPTSAEFWIFEAGGSIGNSPAVGDDGTVYFGAWNKKLFALTSKGKKKWHFETQEGINASPTLAPDGTIYFGSRDHNFYALNPDGQLKWKIDLGVQLQTTAALAHDGTIYIAAITKLIALDSEGNEKWSFPRLRVKSLFENSPAIGHDGTIYVSSTNSFLYAINPDGTEKWIIKIGNFNCASPAVGPDGTIYIGGYDYCIYAINPDGSLKWSFPIDDLTWVSPSVDENGVVYIGTGFWEGCMYAINPNGTLKWKVCDFYGFEGATPIIGDNGVLYAGGDHGAYYRINPDGSVEKKGNLRFGIYGMTMDEQGNNYIGTAAGWLYHMETFASGPAPGGWPMFGHDCHNTRSCYDPHTPVARVTHKKIYINPGETVDLDGSLSFDPDGDQLSYEWRCVDKSNFRPISLTDSTNVRTQVTFQKYDIGWYRFALTIYDNSGRHSTDIVMVYCGFKWQYQMDTAVSSAPGVSPNHNVCFFSDRNSVANVFDSAGDKIDEISISCNSFPVYDEAGNLYLSDYRTIIVLDQNHEEVWRNKFDQTVLGNPVIDKDGSIYQAAGPKIHIFNSTGELKSVHQISAGYNTSLSIGPDGTIYQTRCDTNKDNLFAISSDGSIKWSSPYNYCRSIAFGLDGTIYSNISQQLNAIRPDGTFKWSYSIAPHVFKTDPVVGKEGVIYQTMPDNALLAINPDGTEKWKFLSEGVSNSSPVVGADATIYLCDDAGKLYALNAEGELLWDFKAESEINFSPALTDDGMLYFSAEKMLYAIQTPSMGLANSNWPKALFDSRNSASARNKNCPIALVASDSLVYQFGENIVLDGSLSYDPDNEPLYYEWRCLEKPVGSVVTFQDSSLATTSVEVNKFGHYRFSFTVTDNEDGASVQNVDLDYVMLWSLNLSDEIRSCPAIGQDGTIYVLTYSYYGNLYALNPDGSIKWKFETGNYSYGSPVIAADETIYILPRGRLVAITPEGLLKWEYKLEYKATSMLALGKDGSIYLPLEDGMLAIIDPNGALKMTIPDIETYVGSLAVGSDNTIYIGGKDNHFNAFTADGQLKWRIQTQGKIQNAPAIDWNGNLYVCDDTGKLYAISPDSTLLWTFETEEFALTTPVIDQNGVIYFGTNEGNFYAVNSNGTEKWRFKIGKAIVPPVLGSDNTIYLHSIYDTYLYALNYDGNLKWQFELPGKCRGAASIDRQGVLYFGMGGGSFNAFITTGDGLLQSAWPKYGKNLSNSFGFGNDVQNTIPVLVTPANSYYVAPGCELTLDASSSYDPNGNPLNFTWRCIQKPVTGEVILPDSTSSKIAVRFGPYAIGDYVFQIFVSDADGDTASKKIKINCGLKWRFATWGEVESSPAIINDEIIYIGSNDDSLYAIRTDGSLAWASFTGHVGQSVPVVDESGIIYIGSSSGNRFGAFYFNGTPIWQVTELGNINSTPALAENHTLFIGDANNLSAIALNGIIKWIYQEGNGFLSSPVIDGLGNVLVGSSDPSLNSISPDGNQNWIFQTEGEILSSPCLDVDGTIYFGSQDQKIYALHSDGREKWSYKTSGECNASPVLGDDGTVYCGASDSVFYALNPEDGALKWSFRTRGEILGSAVVDSNGVVYLGSGDGQIYALSSAGKLLWSYKTGGSIKSSLAMDKNGVLYFGCCDSSVYAIQTASDGLAKSYWPTFHRNNRRLGRAEAKETGIAKEGQSKIPTQFNLFSPFPNPFNPQTIIRFALPEAEKVEIQIFNMQGQCVEKICEREFPVGIHTVRWNATQVAAGIYFIQMKSGSFVSTRKCVLLK